MPPVKLDENVPDSVGTILRETGHDVAFARDEQLAGVPDDQVLAAAAGVRQIAVTLAALLTSERVVGRLWVLTESRLRIWPRGPD